MNTNTSKIGVVTPKNFPAFAKTTGAPHQAIERACALVHSFDWKRDYQPSMKEAKERMEKARSTGSRTLWWQVWCLCSKEHNAAKLRRKKQQHRDFISSRTSASPLAEALVSSGLVK